MICLRYSVLIITIVYICACVFLILNSVLPIFNYFVSVAACLVLLWIFSFTFKNVTKFESEKLIQIWNDFCDPPLFIKKAKLIANSPFARKMTRLHYQLYLIIALNDAGEFQTAFEIATHLKIPDNEKYRVLELGLKRYLVDYYLKENNLEEAVIQ